MSFHGFIIRLVVIALTTWTVGSIGDSFGWAFICALCLLGFHEMLRPRQPR